MSDARYHFRAWVRRGVGADAGDPDGPGIPARATLDVALDVTARQGDADVAVNPAPAVSVHLHGPGDVVGIDPRHVIRTEPRDLTVNFEPNYLAGIEFDQPDFPWLFTPARPAGERLRPWVALVVLADGEWTAPNVPPDPLPVIDVQDVAALQPLDDAWNWAHAQISSDADLTATMTTNLGAAISRLLCPRRLDPETAYTAFLVPAFDVGRRAGLKEDVSGVATAAPSWTAATAAPLRLPVYFRFSFRTSDAGDFESLVRKLVPTLLPAEVGIAPMDVDHPADGVPGAGPPLGLEGALRSALTVASDWTGPSRDAFRAAVQDLVNEGTGSAHDDPDAPAPDDPRVVPPAYGRWHAGLAAVDRTQPGWLPDLNLDPRNRAAAGMGTQIVQDERTALLASAWAQVAGVLEANTRLRHAQLSRAVLRQVFGRHLERADLTTFMTLTAPLHARVLASPRTVAAAFEGSAVPSRLLSGSFRRAGRPLGPVARRAARLAGLPRGLPGARGHPDGSLLERLNAGALRLAPPPAPPDGLASLDDVGTREEDVTLPDWLPAWLRALLRRLAEEFGDDLPLAVIVLAALVAIALVAAALEAGAPPAVVAAAAVAGAALVGLAIAARPALARLGRAAKAAGPLRWEHLTPAAVRDAAPAPSFAVTDPPTGLGAAVPGTAVMGVPGGGPPGADSAPARALRDSAAAMLGVLHEPPRDAEPPPPLDLPALGGALLERLDPAVTIPARMGAIVGLAGGPWFAADPIEPIMAAPTFPQADVRAAARPRPGLPAARRRAHPARLARRRGSPTTRSSRPTWSASTTSWPGSCCGTATRPTSAAATSASSGTWPATSRSPATPPTRRSWPSCSRTSRPCTRGRTPSRWACTRTAPTSWSTTSCCSCAANCCAATPTRRSSRARPRRVPAATTAACSTPRTSAIRSSAGRSRPTSRSSASTSRSKTRGAARRPRPRASSSSSRSP